METSAQVVAERMVDFQQSRSQLPADLQQQMLAASKSAYLEEAYSICNQQADYHTLSCLLLPGDLDSCGLMMSGLWHES